ncbi:hypothetical protein GLOIN_2v1490808, partial [Rhizophagus irregularis DAOM 181602=DAOM 197198]
DFLIIAMAQVPFLFYIFCISWNGSYPSKCLVTHLIWHANPDIWELIFYQTWLSLYLPSKLSSSSCSNSHNRHIFSLVIP